MSSFTEKDYEQCIKLNEQIDFNKQMIESEMSLAEPCEEYIEYLKKRENEYMTKLQEYKCKFWLLRQNIPLMKEYRTLKIQSMLAEGTSANEVLLHFSSTI